MLDKKILIIIGVIIVLAIISIIIVMNTGKSTSTTTTQRLRSVNVTATAAGDRQVVLSDTNGNLSSIPSSDGLVPRGTIVMWSGNKTNVPQGWVLCNGQNGTPDLRGRMIKMYSDDIVGETANNNAFVKAATVGDSDINSSGFSRKETTSYIRRLNIGARGGSDVTQQDVRELPPHSHPSGGFVKWGGSGVGYSGGGNAIAGNWEIGLTGNGLIMNNTPAYYVLAFIMKL